MKRVIARALFISAGPMVWTRPNQSVPIAEFYGMSNNRYLWVDLTNARARLGFEQRDRAEDRLV